MKLAKEMPIKKKKECEGGKKEMKKKMFTENATRC